MPKVHLRMGDFTHYANLFCIFRHILILKFLADYHSCPLIWTIFPFTLLKFLVIHVQFYIFRSKDSVQCHRYTFSLIIFRFRNKKFLGLALRFTVPLVENSGFRFKLYLVSGVQCPSFSFTPIICILTEQRIYSSDYKVHGHFTILVEISRFSF